MRVPVHLKFLFLIAVAVTLCGLSCARLFGERYTVDKASPNGIYRVKIDVWDEEPTGTGTRTFTERLKIEYFKGQNVVYAYEGQNSDDYEDSLKSGLEVVEWVGDNVLRMGHASLSAQPFSDELVVTNRTNENLKYVSVRSDRHESFMVFDLMPGSQITLHASPQQRLDGTSSYFLSYSGITQSGKEFVEIMNQKNSPAARPLQFPMNISVK